MTQIKDLKLPIGYTIKSVSSEEFKKLAQKKAKQIFASDTYSYWPADTRTNTEKKKLKLLNKNINNNYRLHLMLYDKNKLIGWSAGWQDSTDTFCMANSALLPKYRGRGLYKILLNEVMRTVIAAGFMKIDSSHIQTNNPIIICKLKHGFTISGVRVDYRVGCLVDLSFHVKPIEKEIARFRVGYRASKKVKDILKTK